MPTDYSRDKFPPAPILPVRFSAPRQTPQMDPVPALVDTGGDFTLVPLSWLTKIDAPEVRSAYLRGLWSDQRQVTLYLVDVYLERTILPALEVIGVEDAESDGEIILGRNVLNRLILLLDGPRENAQVLEQVPSKSQR